MMFTLLIACAALRQESVTRRAVELSAEAVTVWPPQEEVEPNDGMETPPAQPEGVHPLPAHENPFAPEGVHPLPAHENPFAPEGVHAVPPREGGAGAGKTVSRCCCNAAEPDPLYVCLVDGELYYPAQEKKPKKDVAYKIVTLESVLNTTSTCSSGKVQYSRKSGKGTEHTLYLPKMPYSYSPYTFGPPVQYPKYDGFREKSPNMKHIVVNEVIYGPTDNHRSKSTFHGQSFCNHYEKTASLSPAGTKPVFDHKTVTWKEKATHKCEDVTTCRGYHTAHACGFHLRNGQQVSTFLLKRVGRHGDCKDVTLSTWFTSAHCPSGTFHNDYKAKLMGVPTATTFKFCDCTAQSQCASGGK